MKASRLLSHWTQWEVAVLHGKQRDADLLTGKLGPAPRVEEEDGMLCVDHDVGTLLMRAKLVAQVEVGEKQGLLWMRQILLWKWKREKHGWALLWLRQGGAVPGLAETGASHCVG